jgi:O-antigen/teichoic acid export membrane protein
MSTIRNVFYMGSSTAVRVGFNMLVVAVMARMLGPELYGVVALWISVSGLICLVANFGLGTYVLREIGANPADARDVMCRVLAAKLLLSLLVLIGGVATLPFLSAEARWVFALLLLSQLTDAMTDLFNVGFRATNRFSQETRIATISAVAQFAIISVSLLVSATTVCAAASILVSRVVVVLMTWGVQQSYFSGLRPTGFNSAMRCIRDCAAYGVDFFLQGLFGQIDSVLLDLFVGKTAVGLYMAGMRLFLGGGQAAGVLANVFLPRAAAASKDHSNFKDEARLVQRVFIGAGAAFGLALTILSKPLTLLLFGARFAALAELLPWFGLLFFVRFFASSWGIILTSAGQQGFRAWSNVAMWTLQLVLAAVLIPRFGTIGWLIALICGHAFLSAIYMMRGVRTTPLCTSTLALTGVFACAFVPFIHLPGAG